MKKSWLTRTVLILTAVSCLNDVASELLYPVLPLYLASIGYGAVWIGVLEGIAEAVGGLTKGWFGEWSDHIGRRKPFTIIGYLFSAVCKPLIALFPFVGWVLLMRIGDRLGKGIRTGARDALLADESEPKTRGRVFGFHRMGDTVGAVIGPAVALVWLNQHRGESYAPIFFYGLLPGLLSILLLLFIREKRKQAKSGKLHSPFSSFVYWKRASGDYRKLVTGILLFTLFNSSDLFLLLLVKKNLASEVSVLGASISSDMFVVSLYILYNIVYAFFSYPAGWLSDKFGPKRMLIAGYTAFVLAYAGMACVAGGLMNAPGFIIACFIVYGLYPALTDGVSKAWISTVCDPGDKGVALGLFSALTSVALLLASVAAGFVWTYIHPLAVFILPALFAFLAMIYLTFAVKSPVHEQD